MAYQLADIWTYYRGRIQYRNKLMGPTPLNPKSIEAWIRKGMGIDDVDELKRQVIKTAIELGYEANDDMTVEQLQELAEKMARFQHTNGFKRDPVHGLYIEGRHIKSMMKEVVSIEFPYPEFKWE